MMTVVMGRRPFGQPMILILAVLFLEILLRVPTEARFVGAKNKKIHKFFDESYDSFFDVAEDETETQTETEPETQTETQTTPKTEPKTETEPGYHSTSSRTLGSTEETTGQKFQEEAEEELEEDGEEVHDDDSVSMRGWKESADSSDLLLHSEKESKGIDPCLGIRCRIGRVCRANDAHDGFSGVWCVCADADYCASSSSSSSHGRRKRRMRVMRRVCGSDGVFYLNHCEMHRMACVKNQRIRANRNESLCLKSQRQQHQQKQQQPTDGNSRELLHSGLPLPTEGQVSSTVKVPPDQPSVTALPVQSLALPSGASGGCTEVEYDRFVENLLQADCARTGKGNCTDRGNRHQSIDDVMFGYYDNDSDHRLDVAELDAAERRDHLSELSTTCGLRDLMRFGDKDLDLTLTLAEFYAALRVSRVHLDEALEVFLTSATVGTSLELKCDVSGTTDYVWTRHGQVVGVSDVTDTIKVFNDGSLYISEVSLYHVGNYSCQDRQNDDVVQVHIISVHVPPIVEVSPKTRFLASGSTLTIRCHAEAVPVPGISWTANEMPLSDRPDHYTLLHDGLTLQIRDADDSVDSGTFKCRANNDAGSSEDVATVFVESPDALRTAYSEEFYELFVVFYEEGFGVYEPSHCHLHHVVKGDFKVAPRDADGQPVNLCEKEGQSSEATCVWGAAVNVKNRFIYVTQPELNRIVVIEIQDRLNPVEIIPTDGSPVEIAYMEHLDQVWLLCAAHHNLTSKPRGSSGDAEPSKTALVIQRASADIRHSIIHTQPVTDKFDVVKHLFLPPANAFQQTSDYGYVVRAGGGKEGADDGLALHKIDLNSMKYVKRLEDVEKNRCTPNRLAFIPLAGMIFANCDHVASSSDPPPSSNLSSSSSSSSSCFTIDYVTDKTLADSVLTSSCGDPHVSPDSRHLVIIKDNRKSLVVYRVDDDGSVHLAFDEIVDVHIGDVTFFATETGYDLFAKAVDQSVVVYMNLASGHMETIRESIGQWKSSDDHSLVNKNNSGRFLPIVSGGVFSDYLLTPSTLALYVIDARRRQVQCEWQDVRHATVVTWVQVSSR